MGARPTGRSDDGTSGGVVAAPRIGIQLDDMAVSSGKSSWKVEGLDWRLVLYRARHFTYSMVTLYLTCGIGYTGENVRKLSEVARAIKAAGVPFLIVADWNMQPDELQRSGFLDLVEGVLAVPADLDYTCISGRLLDYAVVHPGLAPAVQLMHYSKAPWAAHRTLQVLVHKNPRSVMIRAMVQPRPLEGRAGPWWGMAEAPSGFGQELRQAAQSMGFLQTASALNLEQTLDLSTQYALWSAAAEACFDGAGEGQPVFGKGRVQCPLSPGRPW